MAMKLNVTIQLYRMRDWRLVEANDGAGNRRTCILIPCLQNGLRFNKQGLPYLAMIGRRGYGDKENRHGYILTPYISATMHDKMLEQGVLSEDDEYWAPVIGSAKMFDYESKGGPFKPRKGGDGG